MIVEVAINHAGIAVLPGNAAKAHIEAGTLVEILQDWKPQGGRFALVWQASRHLSPRVRAFWAAIGTWLEKDRRLARLTKLHRGKRIDLLRTGSAFQIRRRGEDPATALNVGHCRQQNRSRKGPTRRYPDAMRTSRLLVGWPCEVDPIRRPRRAIV